MECVALSSAAGCERSFLLTTIDSLQHLNLSETYPIFYNIESISIEEIKQKTKNKQTIIKETFNFTQFSSKNHKCPRIFHLFHDIYFNLFIFVNTSRLHIVSFCILHLHSKQKPTFYIYFLFTL